MQDESTKPPQESRVRKLAIGMVSLTGQGLLTSALSFVFLAVLLRLVTASDFNGYSAVVVSIGLGITVSTFSLQYTASRYIALFEDDESKMWAAGKSIMTLSSIFSIVALVIFELLAPSLSLYFMKSPNWILLFQLGGIWLFSYSLSTVMHGIMAGMKRYRSLAMMLSFSRIIMLAFTIFTLELTHDITLAIIAWIINYVILIFWTFTLIGRRLLRAKYWHRYSELLRYSAPLAVGSILGMVAANADLVIVGGYLPSLGVYSTAVQISSVLSIILTTPLVTMFLPEVSSSINRDIEISNAIRLAIHFLMLVLLPASFLMAALSSQLLTLFSGGGIYLAGAEPLQVIAITYIIFAIHFPIYSALQAIGRTVQLLIAGAIVVAMDVSFAFLLVPTFGILGASLDKAIVALVWMVSTMYFARDYLRRMDPCLFYIKAFISAAVPFGVVLELSAISNRTITIIPYSLIGAALFLICVKATKLLTEEDRALISHLLPAQMRVVLRHL